MFLEIYKSNIPFESLYGCVYQLKNNHVLGDILNIDGIKYIITSTLNPTIVIGKYTKQALNDAETKFNKDRYVQLARLDYIDILRSDTKLSIDGFICVPITKRFYKIKAFNESMNEIIDNDDFKDKIEYYYKRVIK